MGRRTRGNLNEDVQEGDRDDEQVHRGPENYMETPESERDEKQVHRGLETMETPDGDRDH